MKLKISTVSKNDDLLRNIEAEEKESKMDHELYSKTNLLPEEAAWAIWKQWMTIRRLIDTSTTQIEMPNTQKD